MKRLKLAKYLILNNKVEVPGIDPGTSRMLSERSTIWATPPHISREIFLYIYIATALLRHNGCASNSFKRNDIFENLFSSLHFTTKYNWFSIKTVKVVFYRQNFTSSNWKFLISLYTIKKIKEYIKSFSNNR